VNVNPWVIPGSLQNLPVVDGKIAGFHFVFRMGLGVTHLYVTHRMTLSVDGVDASSNLRLRRDGLTIRADELPETDWVCRAGEPIEVIAEFPGGLKRGQHRIKLEVLSGGNYGGRIGTGAPRVLCEFEDELV
jgi:hypothetical protein